MNRATPIDELEIRDRLRRCQHDDCTAAPTLLCACGCDRQLCDVHEFEERRAWQVRQGLALIRHRADRQQVETARRNRTR